MKFYFIPLVKLMVLSGAFACYASLQVGVLMFVKAFAAANNIPEEMVEASIEELRSLHYQYMPGLVGAGLLGFAGYAVGKWQGVVASILLFIGGYDEWVYFLLRKEMLPLELPWLDAASIIGKTRMFTNSEHVTRVGIAISTGAALLPSYVLLRAQK